MINFEHVGYRFHKIAYTVQGILSNNSNNTVVKRLLDFYPNLIEDQPNEQSLLICYVDVQIMIFNKEVFTKSIETIWNNTFAKPTCKVKKVSLIKT